MVSDSQVLMKIPVCKKGITLGDGKLRRTKSCELKQTEKRLIRYYEELRKYIVLLCRKASLMFGVVLKKIT